MPSYCLTLQYKGTDFSGWQIQPDQRTIQGELNQALKKITQSEDIYSLGASRTDAGVHALGQVAKVDLPFGIECQGLLNGLNSNLPKDIKISDARQCFPNFEPIFHAKKKIYQYKFTCRRPLPPHFNDFIAWNKYDLDLGLVQKGCEAFVGEHDFRNFFTMGTPVNSTVRRIYSCQVELVEVDDFWRDYLEHYFVFHFEGNGFLKQMVRLMVGALWNLGQGKISIKDLQKYLGEAHKIANGKRAGMVAPACGLYLTKIIY